MGLEEYELRTWVRQVATGQASRRDFIRAMLGLGLTGPLLAELLATPPSARAQETPGAPRPFTPTRRGGGGTLRLLSWEAPTILAPHFATGIKDKEAARIVYEPLFSVNPEGDFVPILAAEIPSVTNGGRAPDGTWTMWRLKPGVVWHDGAPFTAEDVIFTWEYTKDPATASVYGAYDAIRCIDKLDDHTIKVVFTEPTPLWYDNTGLILPKHRFAAYQGARAREAPDTLRPIGTGPYTLVDFKPGDVALYALNPHYHVPNRPFFDTVELKGGGDATAAARAVLQTGAFDVAWSLVSIDKDVMERLAQQGRKGAFHFTRSPNMGMIQLNRTDPRTEVDGERSSVKVPYPWFTDLRVRQAVALAVDRRTIVEHIWGATGEVTSNILNAPRQFQSPNTRWEFNLDKAAGLLEQAGWQRGRDGVRVKGGRRMQVVFQAGGNLNRQRMQAIVKQALEHLGIEVELKAINAGVFVSSDPENPDTYRHLYADMQWIGTGGWIDPQWFMRQFVSWDCSFA
jgi:peptide/nickel transport system substrate-binding protein